MSLVAADEAEEPHGPSRLNSRLILCTLSGVRNGGPARLIQAVGRLQGEVKASRRPGDDEVSALTVDTKDRFLNDIGPGDAEVIQDQSSLAGAPEDAKLAETIRGSCVEGDRAGVNRGPIDEEVIRPALVIELHRDLIPSICVPGETRSLPNALNCGAVVNAVVRAKTESACARSSGVFCGDEHVSNRCATQGANPEIDGYVRFAFESGEAPNRG